MNKIPVSKLAASVAHNADSGQEEALQFIKDLFTIVEEEITKGNAVNIDNLGELKASDIPGEPVSFTPSDDFASELNDQFAMFSPVELNDSITDDLLDRIDQEEKIIEPASDAVAEDSEEQSLVIHSELSADGIDSPDFESESEIKDSPAKNGDSVIETNKCVIASSFKTEVPTSEESLESNTEHSEIQPVAETPGYDFKTEANSTDKDSISTESGSGAENSIDGENPDRQDNKSMRQISIPEEDVEYVIVRKGKSRFWSGLLLGLIFGFCIGVICFITYLVLYLHIPVENILTY